MMAVGSELIVTLKRHIQNMNRGFYLNPNTVFTFILYLYLERDGDVRSLNYNSFLFFSTTGKPRLVGACSLGKYAPK